MAIPKIKSLVKAGKGTKKMIQIILGIILARIIYQA